uniref:Uncharacterized protein n=1 Tax=Palpitomonas bilix TaxID=652834 RepID=A0A7S3GFW3_9EUKA|mmetsp:Transcript_47474/g.122898  ORF Transcript_47474/g.122898 Transcript_47474/m.122898 type:complete len:420 (+) Transcript_47474:1066-2325(+)
MSPTDLLLKGMGHLISKIKDLKQKLSPSDIAHLEGMASAGGGAKDEDTPLEHVKELAKAVEEKEALLTKCRVFKLQFLFFKLLTYTNDAIYWNKKKEKEEKDDQWSEDKEAYLRMILEETQTVRFWYRDAKKKMKEHDEETFQKYKSEVVNKVPCLNDGSLDVSTESISSFDEFVNRLEQRYALLGSHDASIQNPEQNWKAHCETQKEEIRRWKDQTKTLVKETVRHMTDKSVWSQMCLWATAWLVSSKSQRRLETEREEEAAKQEMGHYLNTFSQLAEFSMKACQKFPNLGPNLITYPSFFQTLEKDWNTRFASTTQNKHLLDAKWVSENVRMAPEPDRPDDLKQWMIEYLQKIRTQCTQPLRSAKTYRSRYFDGMMKQLQPEWMEIVGSFLTIEIIDRPQLLPFLTAVPRNQFTPIN